MKLGVKKLHDNAKLPEYHSDGASGFDIAILYRVEIPPDCWEVVPTGLAFDIPDGYEIQIRPRSGVSAKTGYILKNTIGTIDSDYTGEVKVVIHNLGDEMLVFEEGERVAQGVLSPVTWADIREVSEIKETPRGACGFGSTGE